MKIGLRSLFLTDPLLPDNALKRELLDNTPPTIKIFSLICFRNLICFVNGKRRKIIKKRSKSYHRRSFTKEIKKALLCMFCVKETGVLLLEGK